jgi:hypothetical protein
MKTLTPDLRRYIGLGLIVMVAAPLILWINSRGRPERLGIKAPYPSTALPASQSILREDIAAHKLLVISGDTGQTIAAIDLPSGFHLSRSRFYNMQQAVRSHALFFMLDTALPPPRGGGGTGGSMPISMLAPPARPIVRNLIVQPSRIETRLCRLSLPVNGNKIATILTGQTIGSFAISDDTVYWIDERPEIHNGVTDATGFHDAVEPASLLKSTSLTTLQTRLVAAHLPLSTWLFADHAACYWNLAVGAPGPLSRSQLWRYAPDLQRPILISDNFTVQPGVRGYELPFDSGDRLYWQETAMISTPVSQPVDSRSGVSGYFPSMGNAGLIDKILVISAKKDGTDRRVILDLPIRNSRNRGLANLQVYQGRLYACLDEQDKDPTRNVRWTYLCRIDPGASQPLVRLLRLPAGGVYDRFKDGYAYFTVTEEQDSVPGNLSVTMVPVYYRWKLPP